MKGTLPLIAAILLFGSIPVSAEVIDPDLSTVEPWDTYGLALVAPGGGRFTGIDSVTVEVRNQDGDPVEGATVVIDLGGSGGGDDPRSECDVCVDPVEPGLTGVTDEFGIAYLNPKVGGCDVCTVVVRANGVTIAVYELIVSTDWNGFNADGMVTGADFAFFSTSFKQSQDPCSDYLGDGGVSGSDFSFFSTSFKGDDTNPNGCE
jgi:hypothetical protein